MSFEFHPVVHDFPALTPEQRASLLESIRENGCLHPPTAWRDPKTGKLLHIDGRHRLDICRELGIDPPAPKIIECLESEAVLLAWSLNDQRRHWESMGQRALAAVQLVKRLRELTSDKRPPKMGGKRAKALLQAAEQSHINVRMLERAERVENQGSAALKKAVKDGRLSLADAEAIVSQPPHVQDDAVNRVANGKARTAKKAAADINRGDAWEGDEPEPKVEPMDMLGNPIPKKLRDVFASLTEAMTAAVKLEQEVRRTVRSMAAWNPFSLWAQMEERSDNQIEDLKNALPYVVHQDCAGNGCEQCMQTGWLPKWRYEEIQLSKGQ